jgi:methionine--tRNA ligase beta chain
MEAGRFRGCHGLGYCHWTGVEVSWRGCIVARSGAALAPASATASARVRFKMRCASAFVHHRVNAAGLQICWLPGTTVRARKHANKARYSNTDPGDCLRLRMMFTDRYDTGAITTFYGVPPLARTHWRALCSQVTALPDYTDLDAIIETCRSAIPENSELWGSKSDVTERGQAVQQFLHRLRREDPERLAKEILPSMINRERKRFLMGTKLTVADVVALFAVRPVIARWNRSSETRYDSEEMLNLWDWFDFTQHAVHEFGDQETFHIVLPPVAHALFDYEILDLQDEALIDKLWSPDSDNQNAGEIRLVFSSIPDEAASDATAGITSAVKDSERDSGAGVGAGSGTRRKTKGTRGRQASADASSRAVSDVDDEEAAFEAVANAVDVSGGIGIANESANGAKQVSAWGKATTKQRRSRASATGGSGQAQAADTASLGERKRATDDASGNDSEYNSVSPRPAQANAADTMSTTKAASEDTETRSEQVDHETPPASMENAAPAMKLSKTKTPEAPPPKAAGPSPTSTKEDRSPLARVDIRVGEILTAKPHPDADALYVEEIDIGRDSGPVTVCSGLRKYIPDAAELLGPCIVVANLKPVKMRGIVSEAMVLCATSADGTQVELVKPPPGAKPGDRVYFPGTDADRDNQPDAQLNPKKKIFEKVAEHFRTSTDPSCEARYGDIPFTTDKGPCRAATIQGGTIR